MEPTAGRERLTLPVQLSNLLPMPARPRLLLAALLVAYASTAWPQDDGDDDLLAPLTPAEGKTKKKRKKATPLPPAGPLVREKDKEPAAAE